MPTPASAPAFLPDNASSASSALRLTLQWSLPTSHPTLPVSYSGIHGNAIIPKLERESHHGPPPPPPLQEIKAGGKQVSRTSRPGQARASTCQRNWCSSSPRVSKWQHASGCQNLFTCIIPIHLPGPLTNTLGHPIPSSPTGTRGNNLINGRGSNSPSLSLLVIPYLSFFLRAFSSPRPAKQHQQPVFINTNQKHLHT
jgi:hypothetical protein